MVSFPAHDDGGIKLDADDEQHIHSLMLNLALRRLIADFAAMNRTPEQAQEYINDFRKMLNDFSDLTKTETTPRSRALDREMRSIANLLLDGITFAGADK